jgi:cytochrome b
MRRAYDRVRRGAPVGMDVAVRASNGSDRHKGEEGQMREIADEFMKLLAVIMVLVTLAVSTAAFSMMFG